jgi:hypothetical protein
MVSLRITSARYLPARVVNGLVDCANRMPDRGCEIADSQSFLDLRYILEKLRILILR